MDSFSLLPLQYYKPLNIRVALIGLEVWTNQDLISVTDNPHSTLAAFLSWRSKQLHKLPNDNAQLITSVTLMFSFFPQMPTLLPATQPSSRSHL